MRRPRFSGFVSIAVLLFLYIPILILIISSFNASRFGGEWEGFSLRWYVRLFQDREIWHAVQNTLIVGVTATVISTVLGSMVAYAIFRFKSYLQKISFLLTYSTLILPEVLMGMSMLLLFMTLFVPLGLTTIIITHTTFCIAYVALVVLARLEHFNIDVIEAAQDVGASLTQVAFKIVIPMLMPAILSGALLAFTISIDDYIITSFVVGPGSSTLPIHIYGMIKFGATPEVNALSTILILITFFLAFFTQSLTKESVV